MGSVNKTLRGDQPALSHGQARAFPQRHGVVTLHRAAARMLALFLALFSVVAVSLTTAQTAHAGPVPIVVGAVRAAATFAAPAAVEAVMPSNEVLDMEFTDIERYANTGGGNTNPPGGSGTGGNGGSSGGTYQSPSAAKKGGKAGAIFGLLTSILGIGAIELDFGFGSSATPEYADPPTTTGWPGGCWTPSIVENCTQQVGPYATTSTSAWRANYVIVNDGPTRASSSGTNDRFKAINLTVGRTTQGGTTVVNVIDVACATRLDGAGASLKPYSFVPPADGSSVNVTIDMNTWCTQGYGAVHFNARNAGSSSTVFGQYYFGSYQIASTGVEPGTTPVTTTGTSNCRNTTTGVLTPRPGTPNTYAFADGGGRVTYPSCEAGEVRESISTSSKTADGTDVKTPIPATLNAPITPPSYAECQPEGICTLVLTRHAPGTGQQIGSTATDIMPFRDWLNQTSTSTTTTTRTATETDGSTITEKTRAYPDGSTIECRFGPYIVPYAHCESIPTEPVDPQAPTQNDRICNLDITWNPVSWVVEPVKCALTWAFKPSANASTAWKDRIASISGRPPVNIIVGMVTFLGDAINISVAGTCDFSFDTPQGVEFDPMCEAGDYMQEDTNGQKIYRMAEVAIIGAFVWWAWRRIGMGFGGKETT